MRWPDCLALLGGGLLGGAGCDVPRPAVDQAHQAEGFYAGGWTPFDGALLVGLGLWLAWWWVWRRVK